MRRTAFAVALTLAALLTGALTHLAGAYANPAPASWMLPTPFSSPFQSASSELALRTYDGEIAALMRTGIGRARARQALALQGQVEREQATRRLEAALGSAYAGAWLEPAIPRLSVGVVSSSARATTKALLARLGLASHGREVHVRSTWRALLRSQHRWSRKLGDLLRGGRAETALSPRRNAVVLTLSTSIAAARRLHIVREARHASVNTVVEVQRHLGLGKDGNTTCAKFVSDKARCSEPITAGVTIESGTKKICTAGPVTMPTGAEKRRTYILTAGHCIEKGGGLGETWSAFVNESEEEPIGKAVTLVNGEAADIGAIEVANPGYWTEPGNLPAFGVFARWNLPEGGTSLSVSGELTPIEGKSNCKEGQTSGETCGRVKNLEVELEGTKHLVEDEGAASEPGDSGGPWFSTEGKPEETLGLLLEGTHVGKKAGNGIYEPLATGLKELAPLLSLEAVTEHNEDRPENPCLTGTPDPAAFGFHNVGSIITLTVTVTESGCALGVGEEVKVRREKMSGSSYFKIYAAGKDECKEFSFFEAGEKCKTEFAFEPGAAGKFEAVWAYEYNGGTYKLKLTGATPLWLRAEKSLGGAESATTDAKFALHVKKISTLLGGGEVTVSCDGRFLGTVGPAATDSTTLLESLSGLEPDALKCEAKSSTNAFCKVGAIATVQPSNLPWSTQLTVAESKLFDRITATGKQVGYSLTCSGLSNSCSAESELEEFVRNTEAGAVFASKELVIDSCTTGEATLTGEGTVLGFSTS